MQKGPNPERNREIYEARQNGEMYTSISARYGITPSRAKTISDDYARMLKYSDDPKPEEKYLVVVKGSASTIKIKEVDRIYNLYGKNMVVWKNIGSKVTSRARFDKLNVIFKTGSLEDAERFVDMTLDAVRKEQERHQDEMNKILAPVDF